MPCVVLPPFWSAEPQVPWQGDVHCCSSLHFCPENGKGLFLYAFECVNISNFLACSWGFSFVNILVMKLCLKKPFHKKSIQAISSEQPKSCSFWATTLPCSFFHLMALPPLLTSHAHFSGNSQVRAPKFKLYWMCSFVPFEERYKRPGCENLRLHFCCT